MEERDWLIRQNFFRLSLWIFRLLQVGVLLVISSHGKVIDMLLWILLPQSGLAYLTNAKTVKLYCICPF